MIAGRGTPDQAPARLFAYRRSGRLCSADRYPGRASASYLVRQLAGRRRCGADLRYLGGRPAAGGVPALVHRADAADRREGSRGRCREQRSSAFRAAPARRCCAMSSEVPVDAVGLDWMVDRPFAREQIQRRMPVQGNLDPLVLVAGGAALDARSMRCSKPSRTARSSSISATAFCRRRRSPMWSRCWRGCADAELSSDARSDGSCGDRASDHGAGGARDVAAVRALSWLKALHVIAVIAWMAGMLYLPRLFVYHCEAEPGSQQSETFKVMERRLLTVDHQSGHGGDLGARPVAGLDGRLVHAAGSTPSSCWCCRCRRCTDFSCAGCAISPPTANRHSQKFYRIINEVPTVLMIAHRDPGGGEAVLSGTRSRLSVERASRLRAALAPSATHLRRNRLFISSLISPNAGGCIRVRPV